MFITSCRLADDTKNKISSGLWGSKTRKCSLLLVRSMTRLWLPWTVRPLCKNCPRDNKHKVSSGMKYTGYNLTVLKLTWAKVDTPLSSKLMGALRMTVPLPVTLAILFAVWASIGSASGSKSTKSSISKVKWKDAPESRSHSAKVDSRSFPLHFEQAANIKECGHKFGVVATTSGLHITVQAAGGVLSGLDYVCSKDTYIGLYPGTCIFSTKTITNSISQTHATRSLSQVKTILQISSCINNIQPYLT